MKLLLLIPDKSGLVLFNILGKTDSAKLQAYQHFITMLLCDVRRLYSTYGTDALDAMRTYAGSSLLLLTLLMPMSVYILRNMDPSLALLIQDVTILPVADSSVLELVVTMTFTDGESISKEFY